MRPHALSWPLTGSGGGSFSDCFITPESPLVLPGVFYERFVSFDFS